MSASIFNWDWFTDPPWERVSLWWLQNYVKNVRTNPIALETMRENRAEFEVVPVPVAVIRHLADASVDPSTLPEEPRLDRAPMVDVVRKFAEALEARNLDAAMEQVSGSYFDALNRNSDQLREDLDRLIQGMPDIQIRPGDLTELEAIDQQVLATLDVTWQTEESGHRQQSRIELFLSRGPEEDWRIESIRTI